MSDKRVLREHAMREASASNAQKPKYEAPAIIELTDPVKGAAGQTCLSGSAEATACAGGGSALASCGPGVAF